MQLLKLSKMNILFCMHILSKYVRFLYYAYGKECVLFVRRLVRVSVSKDAWIYIFYGAVENEAREHQLFGVAL